MMQNNSSTFRRASHRSAKTLIELVLVIALIGMVLPVASSLYVQLFRADQQSHIAMAKSLTATRLGNIFRDDVYMARQAVLHDNPGQLQQSKILELQIFDQKTIRYQPQTDKLIRTVSQQDKIVQSDTFRLPKLNVSFTVENLQNRQAPVQMRIAHQQNRHQQIRVSAILNRISVLQSVLRNSRSEEN